ncbi:MAG TPA: hypothetical protein VN976_04070 [Verrucomicrobiae bacterium]|nr:hypothetical protein [Verrucomicrobiae bacterium]
MKTPRRRGAKAPAIGDRLLTPREATRKRGRKRISESRAAEIRARLVDWKQTPESARISLRALAAEISTSHQLLSFYLKRLDEWQGNEQQKEYWRQAKAIRGRADAENRSMSESEMERELAYMQAAGRCMLSSLRDRLFRGFEADAKRGQLHPKIADYLARQLNDPKAQKILRLSKMPAKSKNNLPLVSLCARKSFRSK